MSDAGVILVIAIGVGVISTIRYRKKMKAQQQATSDEAGAVLAAQTLAASDLADDDENEPNEADAPEADSGDSSDGGDAGGD